MIDGTWERTINNGLNAGKKARSETDFFSGASSISYACIEYLKSTGIENTKSKFLPSIVT